MKKLSLIVFFACLALGCSSKPKVKYVFYFIGDGMGINQVMATEQYNKATGNGPDVINFTQFPVRNFITTVSGNSVVTDSAAGGTALASGVKTYNSAVGVDLDGNPVSCITEWASEAGYGTGIITTVGINHATPACFISHTSVRGNYEDISTQFMSAPVDFAAGAGFIMNRRTERTPEYYEKMAEDSGITILRGPEFDGVEDIDGRVLCLSGKQQENLSCAIDRKEGDTQLSDFVKAGIAYLEKHFGKKGFFVMIEGGMIDWACHGTDAATAFQELTDMAYSVDIALEFLNRHPKETLIVITADHETGGLMIGSGKYETHPERLAFQKASAPVITDMFREEFFPEEEPYETPSWEDVKEFFADKLGLWDKVDVSSKDEAALKEVYNKTFGKGGNRNLSSENLYSVNYKIVDEAVKCLDRAAGYRFSYGSHSGSPVGLYVTGAGHEAFREVRDNAEIAPLIAKLAGYRK
jgi:alkaline phosphatase